MLQIQSNFLNCIFLYTYYQCLSYSISFDFFNIISANTCVTVRSDELLKVRLNGQSHLLQSIVANKFLFPIYDYLAYIFLSIISLKGWNLKYISICLS